MSKFGQFMHRCSIFLYNTNVQRHNRKVFLDRFQISVAAIYCRDEKLAKSFLPTGSNNMTHKECLDSL